MIRTEASGLRRQNAITNLPIRCQILSLAVRRLYKAAELQGKAGLGMDENCRISVVVPVKDEAGNVAPLAREIAPR